jgi:hypothetical protein
MGRGTLKLVLAIRGFRRPLHDADGVAASWVAVAGASNSFDENGPPSCNKSKAHEKGVRLHFPASPHTLWFRASRVDDFKKVEMFAQFQHFTQKLKQRVYL